MNPTTPRFLPERHKQRTGKEHFGWLHRDLVGVPITTAAALSIIAFCTMLVLVGAFR